MFNPLATLYEIQTDFCLPFPGELKTAHSKKKIAVLFFTIHKKNFIQKNNVVQLALLFFKHYGTFPLLNCLTKRGVAFYCTTTFKSLQYLTVS